MITPQNPWSIQLEVVEGCNYSCNYCGIHSIRNGKTGWHRYRMMDPELLRVIARQINEWRPGIRIEINNHGEPTLHPEFTNMLRILRQEAPDTHLQLQTNCSMIEDEKTFHQKVSEWFDAGLNLLALNTYKRWWNAKEHEPGESRHDRFLFYSKCTKYKVVDFYYNNPDNESAYRNYGPSNQMIMILDDLGEVNIRLNRKQVKSSKSILNEAGNSPEKTMHALYGHEPLTEPLEKPCTRVYRELTIGWDGIIPLCCFTGDTKISLASGDEVPIDELVGREVFHVYSIDHSTNKIVIGEGYNCHKTRENAPIYAVTLDNGEVVRCTGDHEWMLRDGSYRQAIDLVPGDSLMPLYRFKLPNPGRESSYKDSSENEYEYVINPDGSQVPTHYLADDCNVRTNAYGFDYLVEQFQRHHKDFDSSNNSPDNIERLSYGDHMNLHIAHNLETDESYREKYSEVRRQNMSNYNQSDDHRQVASVMAKIRNEWIAILRSRGISKEQYSFETYYEDNYSSNYNNYGSNTLNHKVVSVEFVGYEDVYDFTVRDYHNFALSAGTFVHNCYDWRNQFVFGKLDLSGTPTLRQIWESPVWNAVRELLYRRNRHFSPCDVCDYDGGPRVGFLKPTGFSGTDEQLLKAIAAHMRKWQHEVYPNAPLKIGDDVIRPAGNFVPVNEVIWKK